MKLYDYPRSSASYRVRIGLQLKGLEFERVPVHLLRDGGEQHSVSYRELNPQSLVPTLWDDGRVVHQSLAILEYLDELHPEPPLLPATPEARARVRAMAQLVACDVHPLNNLRVLQYLEQRLEWPESERLAWVRHWVAEGFQALETRLARGASTGRCCEGDAPTLADVCLVPQVVNARRYDCPLEPYPTLRRIAEHCEALPAFQAAHPDALPEA